MQRVLVAGSTGYIGRFVALEFKKKGYVVRVLARDSRKLEQTGKFLDPPVKDEIDEVFIGEVTKPETLFGLCDGIEREYPYFRIHTIEVVINSPDGLKIKDDETFRYGYPIEGLAGNGSIFPIILPGLQSMRSR